MTNNSDKQAKIPRFIVIFYQMVLPTTTIFFLLILGQILPRNKIGSDFADFVLRIIFCVLFCYAYINMPFISKKFWYLTFPKIERSGIVIFPNSLIRSAGVIILRFIIIVFFTKPIIDEFVPIFSTYSIFMAIINGFIFALPALAQYIYLVRDSERAN